MREDYEKLFAGIDKIQPSQGLYGAVLARIAYEKQRVARMRILLFSGLTSVSLVALIPAFQMLMSDFYQSSFYQYSSLLFSDSGAVMTNWQDFSLSLIESIPLISTVLVLTGVFITLRSLKTVAHDAKLAYSPIN